ncbi:MAG: aminodeoxychorismate synthase component I [Sideroxydans sp.]|nr:aminodeoxychorismate synthase component I [Sideroxydans sp.]
MLYSVPFPYRADVSAYFVTLRDLPWAAWLDSGGRGRYDILVAQPVMTLVTQGATTTVQGVQGVCVEQGDVWELLRSLLGSQCVSEPNLPFMGGALGYWSYDYARHSVNLPRQSENSEALPEACVGIYDWAVIVDHQVCSVRLVSRQRYPETVTQLPLIVARLATAQRDSSIAQRAFEVSGTIRSNFTVEKYRRAFNTVQMYLQEGDCYQVNLAQRFSVKASGDAFAAYLALRQLSPAPFSAFLDWPQCQVLCASPERFVQVKNGQVETKPIKGTRPRSGFADRDRQLAEELRQHPKDRAENLMIVDLLRNDLGKCCEAGTVHVPKLFEVESYANVHHLVSTVKGKLAKGCDALDVLKKCFPGGSITGAPKRRAMQIIEELEPHRRGIYCGVIGYLGHDGDMDTNIAIRTLVYAQGEVRCWAGGGIVADSQCDAEYQETLDKASAMLAVLRKFGGR